MDKEKVYVSISVITTGPSPSTSSCVMLGCVVFKEIRVSKETVNNEWIIDKKMWCLSEIPGTFKKDFWNISSDLWKYLSKNATNPSINMDSFSKWYENILKKYHCTFICQSASRDWQWLNCVYDKFGPPNKPDLPYSAFCVGTFLATLELFGLDWNLDIKSQLEHPIYKSNNLLADDDALYNAYVFLAGKRLVFLNKINDLSYSSVCKRIQK